MSVVLSAARRAAIIAGVTLALATGGGDRPRAAAAMTFGVDSEAVELAAARGRAVSYGTFWVGAWTQKHGWGYAEAQLRAAAAHNVTPVIQWWYWGDDISLAQAPGGTSYVRLAAIGACGTSAA